MGQRDWIFIRDADGWHALPIAGEQQEAAPGWGVEDDGDQLGLEQEDTPETQAVECGR